MPWRISLALKDLAHITVRSARQFKIMGLRPGGRAMPLCFCHALRCARYRVFLQKKFKMGMIGSMKCASGPVVLGSSQSRCLSRPCLSSRVGRRSTLSVRAIAAPLTPTGAEKEKVASDSFVDRVSHLVAVLATTLNFPFSQQIYVFTTSSATSKTP